MEVPAKCVAPGKAQPSRGEHQKCRWVSHRRQRDEGLNINQVCLSVQSVTDRASAR